MERAILRLGKFKSAAIQSAVRSLVELPKTNEISPTPSGLGAVEEHPLADSRGARLGPGL